MGKNYEEHAAASKKAWKKARRGLLTDLSVEELENLHARHRGLVNVLRPLKKGYKRAYKKALRNRDKIAQELIYRYKQTSGSKG